MAITSFPPTGISYFWFLNSDCRLDHLRRQIAEFAEANVHTVVLHPREGLLVPYGSKDWLDLVRTLALELGEKGIKTWLYDEDYCPSGQAGGRILAEHPQYQARAIQQFTPAASLGPGELFVFPCGPLLWAGAVGPNESDTPVDLRDRVGTLRRHWEVADWDSRHYYPDTPLYACPRAGAYLPEYAIKVPALPAGYRLAAFVAVPVGVDQAYGGLLDPLDPAATDALLRHHFDRYADTVGDLFGREIQAIFTDEPKYYGSTPWTPALFESFEQQFGYDLRPRLNHLFDDSDDPCAMLTRLHYRQWLGERFDNAWLRPLAQWCQRHRLKLVGHMSPEDDLVEQSGCLTNLFPLQKPLDLPGLDVIIPAVGDADHAILNVGITMASSSAQQQDKPGVCAELLGASGLGGEINAHRAAAVLAWQVMSGASAPVIHAAYASTMGLRRYDAPPSWGPDGAHWPGMIDIDRGLRPFISIVTGSTQVAPVALLWPIRSFNARSAAQATKMAGQRERFNKLLLNCLEAQVGVHLLDETDLISANVTDGVLHLGRARYETVLVPETDVLHQRTLEQLETLRAAGVRVLLLGCPPRWVQADDRLIELTVEPWERIEQTDSAAELVDHLSPLLPIDAQQRTSLRVTRWLTGNEAWALLMNLDQQRGQRVGIASQTLTLEPGELVALREGSRSWEPVHRFSPASVRHSVGSPPTAACKSWQVRWPDEDWTAIDAPAAMYQLRPHYHRPERFLTMAVTGGSVIGDQPTAPFVDFRAAVELDEAPAHAELVLEPTAARGRFTVHLGEHQWTFELCDTDIEPVMIDLSGLLEAGANELTFRLREPDALDGLRVAPRVHLSRSAVGRQLNRQLICTPTPLSNV